MLHDSISIKEKYFCCCYVFNFLCPQVRFALNQIKISIMQFSLRHNINFQYFATVNFIFFCSYCVWPMQTYGRTGFPFHFQLRYFMYMFASSSFFQKFNYSSRTFFLLCNIFTELFLPPPSTIKSNLFFIPLVWLPVLI